jgi:hypothetical protein
MSAKGAGLVSARGGPHSDLTKVASQASKISKNVHLIIILPNFHLFT